MKKACFGFIGILLFLVLVFSSYGGTAVAATKTTNSNQSGRMLGMHMDTATSSASAASLRISGDMLGMHMGSPPGTGSDPMTNRLQKLNGKDFEITFMQYMMVHHQAAVQMAQLVPTHTKRPQLQTLAQNIIRTQSSEIIEMSTWLKQWYGAQPISNPMTVPGMRDMMRSMEQIKAVYGASFDKQFLTMMIQHHQAADTMANLLPGKTQRPELLHLGKQSRASVANLARR